MTVQTMCGSAGVSRAGYYRHGGRPEVPDEDTELRDAIQKSLWSGRRMGAGVLQPS